MSSHNTVSSTYTQGMSTGLTCGYLCRPEPDSHSCTRDAQHDPDNLHRCEPLSQKQESDENSEHGRQAECDSHHGRDMSRFQSRVEEDDTEPPCEDTSPDSYQADGLPSSGPQFTPERRGEESEKDEAHRCPESRSHYGCEITGLYTFFLEEGSYSPAQGSEDRPEFRSQGRIRSADLIRACRIPPGRRVCCRRISAQGSKRY